MNIRRTALLLIGLVISVALEGCNFPVQSTSQPTGPGPATQAARTLEAMLTQASSGTGLPVVGTPQETPTAPQETPSEINTAAICIDKATFLQDATVPDGTVINPGQAFLKVWALENSGTCSWTQEYRLTFFGGERMGGEPELRLSKSILPGASGELAIDLIAPTAPGTYQGFWRLRNAQGAYFGIGPGGDQSFWVKIRVQGPTATASTPTATLTHTPSPTSTTTPTAQTQETPSPSPTATATETATATPTQTPTTTSTPSKNP